MRANVMMICTRDLSTTLDGELIHLRAGNDRVVADNELYARHPEYFKPVEGGLNSERSVVDGAIDRDMPRASSSDSLERELRIRSQRLAALAQREQARPLPPTSDEQFWSRVDRQLEQAFPDIARQRRESAASEAMLDELEASKARTLDDERNAISSWLNDD